MIQNKKTYENYSVSSGKMKAVSTGKSTPLNITPDITKSNQGPPRKKNGKHLILDLDETLVHTFSDGDNFEGFIENLTEEQHGRVYELQFPRSQIIVGYIRPGVEYFLRTAFDVFESVSVWSAGTYEYVHAIVEILFKNQKPKFVMTRNDCNEIKIKDDNSTCRFKPLEIVYDIYKEFNEDNTLIVDDRNDICKLNCLNNIPVPEFGLNVYNHEKLLKDKSLIKLADWFKSDEFHYATDVKSIKSQSPFSIQ